MYVKFTFNATIGIATSGGVRPLYKKTPMCIEQDSADNALSLMTTLSNNDKVLDAKVVINKPKDEDKETIFITKDGYVEGYSDHLVSNADTQSFVWALKAGMTMQKGLKK